MGSLLTWRSDGLLSEEGIAPDRALRHTSGVSHPHWPVYQHRGMEESEPTVVRGEGMAVASLATGLIGVLFGFVPFFFFVAWILGVLALVFGFVGRARDRPRRKMAGLGAFLGAVSIALGVIGAVLLVTVVADAVVDTVSEAVDGWEADIEGYFEDVEADIGEAIDGAERDLIDEVERELSG